MEGVRILFASGGPVMWPLLLCSLISLTVTVELLTFWRAEARAARRFALEAIAGDDLRAALSPSCAAARVAAAGLAARAPEQAMQTAASRELTRMKRGMGVLDTIITMAPLLGILGTVVGIIASFDIVTGAVDPRTVTRGIAQALLTTAAGLTVALLTLIPHNYFVHRLERTAAELEIAASRVLELRDGAAQ